MSKYIIGIDQSTQSTKAILFDQNGIIVNKCSKNHDQLINDKGWVSHDLEEIYSNVIAVVAELLEKSKITKENVVSIGISNQRETAAAWSRKDGHSFTEAIVWQCARASELCEDLRVAGYGDLVKETTGMNLSPYFSASKFLWMLRNVNDVKIAADENDLCLGTIDSWLLFRLTNGEAFKTDYSNASRTQLLNLKKLKWDSKLCEIFNIPMNTLPELCESNSLFGYTDFDGIFDRKIPIHTMLGDSQAALFGQGCWEKGSVKTTIGTGSSVMMNIGTELKINDVGLLTSIAWKMDGQTSYVIEGNINYAGAVIKWLLEDVKLIESSKETEILASQAFPNDVTYLVPAFTGLGAPYWIDQAAAILCGMTRTTGKAEIVRAALDSIAYQIEDILSSIDHDIGQKTTILKVDGGVTNNKYLMQFQSDISNVNVLVPNMEEFSAFGVAYSAGIAAGLYNRNMENVVKYTIFESNISNEKRQKLINGWKSAVNLILKKN